MATITAIAERRALAFEKLERVSTAFSKKFKVKIEPIPRQHRDPEFGRMLQLESFASLLGQVAVATGALTREELMDNNIGTTAEGQGPSQPNEDGFDTQLSEGAKGQSPEAMEAAKAAEAARADQATTDEPEDLNDLTVAELKDRARDAEVAGFSTMNKDELVKAVKKAEKA